MARSREERAKPGSERFLRLSKDGGTAYTAVDGGTLGNFTYSEERGTADEATDTTALGTRRTGTRELTFNAEGVWDESIADFLEELIEVSDVHAQFGDEVYATGVNYTQANGLLVLTETLNAEEAQAWSFELMITDPPTTGTA